MKTVVLDGSVAQRILGLAEALQKYRKPRVYWPTNNKCGARIDDLVDIGILPLTVVEQVGKQGAVHLVGECVGRDAVGDIAFSTAITLTTAHWADQFEIWKRVGYIIERHDRLNSFMSHKDADAGPLFVYAETAQQLSWVQKRYSNRVQWIPRKSWISASVEGAREVLVNLILLGAARILVAINQTPETKLAQLFRDIRNPDGVATWNADSLPSSYTIPTNGIWKLLDEIQTKDLQ